jgi:hypothetical protein
VNINPAWVAGGNDPSNNKPKHRQNPLMMPDLTEGRNKESNSEFVRQIALNWPSKAAVFV